MLDSFKFAAIFEPKLLDFIARELSAYPKRELSTFYESRIKY